VEQLATAPTTRHALRGAFLAQTEKRVWELVNHGTSRLFATLHHRNTLTYLHTYLRVFP